MKTRTIIAGLVAAAAAAITVYLVRRKRNEEPVEPVRRNHHLTDAFSKAKQYAVPE